MDPQFVAEYRKVFPMILKDQSFYTQNKRNSDTPLAKRLREVYSAATNNCNKMRIYSQHPIIKAKFL